MSKMVTVVIRCEDDEVPSFHANMELLGGKIIRVMLGDALAQLERAELIYECSINEVEL